MQDQEDPENYDGDIIKINITNDLRSKLLEKTENYKSTFDQIAKQTKSFIKFKPIKNKKEGDKVEE